MDEKKYGNIDFKNTKMQTFYIYFSIFKNKEIDNRTLIKIFKSLSKINLDISRSQISKIRTKLTNNYKGLDIVQLVNTLKLTIIDLKVNIEDINYEITIKNKIEKRKERIKFFGIKQKFKCLNK